jgi:hypothetical protein
MFAAHALLCVPAFLAGHSMARQKNWRGSAKTAEKQLFTIAYSVLAAQSIVW